MGVVVAVGGGWREWDLLGKNGVCDSDGGYCDEKEARESHGRIILFDDDLSIDEVVEEVNVNVDEDYEGERRGLLRAMTVMAGCWLAGLTLFV